MKTSEGNTLHSYMIVIPTKSTQVYEISLYTQRPPTGFYQQCGHVQGGMNTIKIIKFNY